jgi:hypothetical protein
MPSSGRFPPADLWAVVFWPVGTGPVRLYLRPPEKQGLLREARDRLQGSPAHHSRSGDFLRPWQAQQQTCHCDGPWIAQATSKAERKDREAPDLRTDSDDEKRFAEFDPNRDTFIATISDWRLLSRCQESGH